MSQVDQRGDGQRGGSDQIGVKGPSGNPQEGPVLPLPMLSKFQNKSLPLPADVIPGPLLQSA